MDTDGVDTKIQITTFQPRHFMVLIKKVNVNDINKNMTS